MRYRVIVFFLIFIITNLVQPLHAQKQFVYAEGGRIYSPQGDELSLWGVNFQPNLSWEFNDRLRPMGAKLEIVSMKQMVVNSLDEIKRMGANLIRCHLTPADFTDSKGNIVETIYLDILDYMVAEAAKRDIYVYITFINHMGNWYVNNSMWIGLSNEEWIFNKDVVNNSKNYISQLLNRSNPYLGTQYKSTPIIALWELINEPRYYSYNAIQSTSYYADFTSWLVNRGLSNNATSYKKYRKELVVNYINEMYRLIRREGATQPIIWNCNWHRMRVGNEDIFEAVAAANIEAVSFCNYPGQDLVTQDYWQNPVNLTDSDFSQFFKNGYNNLDWYAWAISPEFMGKAKVVYEFETFFNQSSYLYPLMAQFYRALGVQAAAMWTYCLDKYAPYHNGSHNLSLTCTPAKSAGFRVAREVFSSIPLYTPFSITTPNEQIQSQFALSKSRDLSIFSSEQKYFYTADVTNWSPLLVNKKVKEIYGRNNSHLVSYNGSGIYAIEIEQDVISLSIEPNATWLYEPWKNNNHKEIVTALDYTSTNKLSLFLEGWDNDSYTLYRIEGNNPNEIEILSNLQNISITPGYYKIARGKLSEIEYNELSDRVIWDNSQLYIPQGAYQTLRVVTTIGNECFLCDLTNRSQVSLSHLPQGAYLLLLSGTINKQIKIYKK